MPRSVQIVKKCQPKPGSVQIRGRLNPSLRCLLFPVAFLKRIGVQHFFILSDFHLLGETVMCLSCTAASPFFMQWERKYSKIAVY